MMISVTPGACLWPAAMVVWGPGYESAEHSHHCVQLVMALEGTLRVRGGSLKTWNRCGAALVRADAPHAVDARKAATLIAFVDPESQLGAALSARIQHDIWFVPQREVARWRRALGNATTLTDARVQVWLRETLLDGEVPVRLHTGVSRVLRHLRAQTDGLSDVSLSRLAAIAGLSQSRFMHVFTESTGVAVRPYILWLRVQRACGALMRGGTVTDAVLHAGFADAAHLTRTFRRMLGITPTELSRRKRTARGVSVDGEVKAAEAAPSA
jgi:AraC-like DNA-binding protein